MDFSLFALTWTFLSFLAISNAAPTLMTRGFASENHEFIVALIVAAVFIAVVVIVSLTWGCIREKRGHTLEASMGINSARR